MGEKSFVVLLGNDLSDRYRLSCETESGKVVLFRVQYEALIGSEWRAIVRYDTAHGFPHRDLMHPDGAEEKNDFSNRSNAEILTLGQEDIKRNWRVYREGYEQELKK
ncbi:MAG: hypothetical protein HY070_03655 [Chloroflexi bacterium]|nr:hypothetical protein [Chloroflexota bacterium]MBI3741238.1 hypothetical protein [Chloroflexota bacterium]